MNIRLGFSLIQQIGLETINYFYIKNMKNETENYSIDFRRK
jgi:hypothetical protein